MPLTFPAPKAGSPLPWLTWPFSLVLPIAVLLLIGTLLTGGGNKAVELAVQDEAGNPLPGTHVLVGNELYLTDDDGVVRLAVEDSPEAVTVERDGYTTMVGKIGQDSDAVVPIVLTPDKMADRPGDNAGAAALASQSEEATPVPEKEDALASAPQEVAGTVADADGNPVARAWVTDGTSYVFSDADGAFLFKKGQVAPDATLRVFGAGYFEQQVEVPQDGILDVTLELQPIKGIYYNPNISNTQEDLDRLINIVNTTEINAVVVDIKEELVFYDSQVQFFRDAGTVSPVMDLPSLLKQLHDNDIYTIARLVVFKDSAVAEKFPYLAVKDNVTGDLWRDMNGIAWVNPMMHELWDYNIELAVEAAHAGFDEIQYDYVRFPTDGDLSRLEYGIPNSQENREAAIEKFLQKSWEALIPTGTRLSADIFGYTVMVEDDLGIGQNLDHLAQHVDYLSPMVYPSHWPDGSMALDGPPNDYPYEAVHISMGLAVDQLNGDALKLRPWLQDFNMSNMMEYGAPEVRAQIDAAEDLGLSGWLIWDPNNWYHEDAFKPESTERVTPQATPAATPQAVSIGYGAAKGRRHR